MNIPAVKEELIKKGWVEVEPNLWNKPGSFIDTTDKKNLVTMDDAIKLQGLIDKWDSEYQQQNNE